MDNMKMKIIPQHRCYKNNESIHFRKIDQIKLKLDECKYVKYSTYRVALKFHVLQDYSYMRAVPLSMIEGVFERHRLQNNESSLCLETPELEAVLYDIYYAANKQSHMNFDVDDATEDMLDLLCCIFDKDNKANIQVLSAKLVLGLLSNCTLRQFYSFLFCLCSDHNNCVTRLRLQSVLMKFIDILTFFEEDVIFGQHLVNSSIEECFAHSPGLVGINEASFIQWLNKDPQLISWIPILDKMKSTYSVVHNVKCSSCKESPLTGLVYKCVKCTKYIQCQHCFFVGRTSHSHKLSHSMREHCSDKNLQDTSSYLLTKLIRKFVCSVKSNEQTVSAVKLQSLRSSYKQYFMKCSAPEYSDIQHLPLQQQLQVIIQQLELQSRHLQMMIHSDQNDIEMMKYLDDHRLHMALQVRRLQMLKDHLGSNQCSNGCDEYSDQLTKSTPKSLNSCHKASRCDLDLLSPIYQASRMHDSERFYTYNNSLDQSQTPADSRCRDTSLEASGPYRCQDISTWIGGQSSSVDSHIVREENRLPKKPQVNRLHTDLDDALAKLQQILANNFSLEEPVSMDNGQLKYAVSEVEGVLTSFIDSVESNSSYSKKSS